MQNIMQQIHCKVTFADYKYLSQATSLSIYLAHTPSVCLQGCYGR